VVALGGTVVVADAGGVVVALGTVVVFNGIVSPGAVVDGNTSPSVRLSSLVLVVPIATSRKKKNSADPLAPLCVRYTLIRLIW
jgi:hypothetical protein